MPQITVVMIAINTIRCRAFIGRRLGEIPSTAYSKAIPNFVLVLQIERQCRRVPSIIASNFVGMPYVVETSRQAPISDIFRAVHSSLGALSLIMIWAALRTRLRDSFRFSSTGTSLALCLITISSIAENAN